MKYSEAKKQIEESSSEYRIDMGDGDFNVVYKSTQGIFVDGTYRYEMCVGNRKAFSKLPFSDKLYMILSELAMTPPEEREEDKKYFIHVFKGEDGYLNIIEDVINEIGIADNRSEIGFKAEFTNDEINQLKKREDVPLDWNKVHLEEVE